MGETSTSVQEVFFVCTCCKVSKKESEFHRNSSRGNGRDSRCKLCISKIKRRSYAFKRRKKKVAVSFTSVIVNQLGDEAAELCGTILGDSIRELIDAGKL